MVAVRIGPDGRLVAVGSPSYFERHAPPTVPQDSARLRITFSAGHAEEQVDRLLDALAEVLC